MHSAEQLRQEHAEIQRRLETLRTAAELLAQNEENGVELARKAVRLVEQLTPHFKRERIVLDLLAKHGSDETLHLIQQLNAIAEHATELEKSLDSHDGRAALQCAQLAALVEEHITKTNAELDKADRIPLPALAVANVNCKNIGECEFEQDEMFPMAGGCGCHDEE